MKTLGALAVLVLVLATGCSSAVDGPVQADDEVETQTGSPTVAALYDGAYLEPALIGDWELTQLDRSFRLERFKIHLGANGFVTPSDVPAVFASDEFFLSAVGEKRMRELLLLVELRRGPWQPLDSRSECP